MGRGDRCSVRTKKCPKPAEKSKQNAHSKQITKKIQNSHGNSCTINVNTHAILSNSTAIKVKARKVSQKRIPSNKMISTEDQKAEKSVKNPSLILIEDESHSTNFESYASPRMNCAVSSSPGNSPALDYNSQDYCSHSQNLHPNQNSIFYSMRCGGNVQQQSRNGSKTSIENIKSYQSINFQGEDLLSLNPLQNPKMRLPSEYSSFIEVPAVYPTEEEFKDPYKLFEMLHQQGYHKHGIVKIIPPKSWKPQYNFDKITEKVTTRTQILAELSQAQPFSQNNDQYTYKEFKKMADDFKKTYKFQTKTSFQNEYRQIEYEFWEHVEHPELFKDELEVEYAADLPSKKYGSAFSVMDNMHNSTFNLNNINSIKNSLFQHFSKDHSGISGISNPWVYLGMMFASFCWHVEDLYMCALNYLHIGEAKTWYGIPPEYKYKFEEVYKKTYPHIFKKKPDVLFHINLMLSPAVALENGIPVYRTEQKPGEFIFTFPKTYHAGFSHGFNCGEAVNVITFDWFQNYQEAVQYYQTIKHPTKNFFKSASFAVEWLISQVIINMEASKFDLPTLVKIKEEWSKIVQAEQQKRKKILAKYGEENLKICEFQNKKERYDRHICWLCGYYSFYSYQFCNSCIKKSCISHDTPCKCNKNPQLFIRYTDEDFAEQEQIINQKMKECSQ
ncbi:hypothetical protein ABPG72_011814 [Tetrahymena utriculariae]